MSPSGGVTLGFAYSPPYLRFIGEWRFDLDPYFNIKNNLGLKPFNAHPCPNFGSVPTRPSAALMTFVIGGAGDRFTDKESFTGFIWFFCVSGLTPFFCGCRF